MTAKADFYTILQVHPEADVEVIQAAYRKLAAKYHPDVSTSPEAVERMKELNEAHEVLTDPDKRAAYDRSLGNIFPQKSLPRGLGGFGRKAFILSGLAITILIAARLGFRVALVIAAGAVIIWLVGKIGK